MKATIRLLPYARADGPHNMAADETLLLAAAEGQPSLRFYGWTTPTLSLGYFQPAQARLSDPRLASLPWVRRPTGGATLVHHHELTYALALGPELAGSPPCWMPRMHGIIARALEKFCLENRFEIASLPNQTDDVLCFQKHTIGDLLCSHHKILGSAQRKHRHSFLQHGGLLLAQSEFTPLLPGIKELTGADLPVPSLIESIAAAFQETTAWQVGQGTWTPEEMKTIDHLAANKYSTAAWNEKR